MLPSKPDLVILPFKALSVPSGVPLTFEEVLFLWRTGRRVCIERSVPGEACAIGWTIFRRTRLEYRYEGEPLFRFENGARRHIRKAYAIHYSLLGEDFLTQTHLDL
jgi:hypothetical protein